MSTEYSLDNALVGKTGGFVPKFIDDLAQQWIGEHYLIAGTIIIVLVIIVIVLLAKSKEGFNPTQNLRDQDSDQFGLGKKEHLDGDRSTSVFATTVQTGTTGALSTTPGAAPGAPGSLGWQVLNDPNFACSTRNAPSDEDAWSWMYGVAKENLSENKPKTDSDFSKVLTGL